MIGYTIELQNQLDYAFIQRIQDEVTQSCALPFALPLERIPEYIRQAADYFFYNYDQASEERYYIIKNSEVNKCNVFNKIVQLPHQIISVFGVYKTQQNTRFSTAGDFSVERLLLSSYSMFGGAGTVGQGMNGMSGAPGYTLSDMVVSMLEVSTFNEMLNAPLSYNYNIHSSKLVLLGDLGTSDILICCMLRCQLQDLYSNPYFFKYVVALCKRSLGLIYGMYTFKLPGGIEIDSSGLKDAAQELIDEVKEWLESQNTCDYFFMSNTL